LTKIFKYQLELTDVQRLLLPRFAKILSVQFQGEDLCLWALVIPDQKSEDRIIRIIGTGHEINPSLQFNLEFIGTVQQYSGSVVWHVFEESK
jgi:hypothetical protein